MDGGRIPPDAAPFSYICAWVGEGGQRPPSSLAPSAAALASSR